MGYKNMTILKYVETLPPLTLLVFAIISLFIAIIAVADFIGTNRDQNNCTDKNMADALFGKAIADFLVTVISGSMFLLLLVKLVLHLI